MTRPRRHLARLAVASLLPAAVVLPGGAVAASPVSPANGSYSWSTTYKESGGARELVTFAVTKRRTATFSTIRGICHGDHGVMKAYDGKEGRVPIKDGRLKKSDEVTLDGDTATVTVRVKWKSSKKAVGWIRVTGSWAGQECTGDKQPFKLAYYK